ncbi:hypothetical protein F0562_018116 [Nyssa sinensis]|uniref:Uncharacterized protein n=1 Tax=Nyssa sinensis TaxID=561372 RepID=A0A5J4ZCW1_9ASTE|nr:hypothetical protein F0562_018116 [Nyssa sinensis]
MKKLNLFSITGRVVVAIGGKCSESATRRWMPTRYYAPPRGAALRHRAQVGQRRCSSTPCQIPGKRISDGGGQRDGGFERVGASIGGDEFGAERLRRCSGATLSFESV